MLETKAILLDGVPGSGKSTLSEWVTGQITSRGVSATLYPEMCSDHPLRVYEPVFTDFTQPAQASAYRERHIALFRAFVRDTLDSDAIVVVDSRLFQGTITSTYFLRMPVDEAIDFALTLLDILMPLQPALVYIAQADMEANWRRICAERGAFWTVRHCGIRCDADFVHAGVSWSAIQAFCLALIAKWDIEKLVLVNSDYDWESHRAAIGAFLRLNTT